ncbi:MAG: hypothetical protein ACJ79W_05985 [Myxococcales bacterium]
MILFSCPVCFGQAGDPSVQSVLLGVGLLLGVVVTVLVAVGSVAITWARRGRQLAALEKEEPEPLPLRSAFPPPPPW